MEPAFAELSSQLHAARSVFMGPRGSLENLPVAQPDLARDLLAVAFYTVVLFVFNWGVRLSLLHPLCGRLLHMERSKVTRCAQSMMEALFYGGFTLLGAMIVPRQAWVWPSINWWVGFATGEHAFIRADLRLYYLAYLGRYVQMSASIMMEPKRKDFREMLLHHVVTVVVISVSYIWGWVRIGVVTMLLLDPADVPLHLAKVCKYVAEARKCSRWQSFADRWFELFAVTFFITRLVLYSYVVWSCVDEGRHNVPEYGGLRWGGIPGIGCFAILLTLLGLQFYWFFLIMKVAIKLMREGKNVEDVRSDDEDSPTTPGGKKKGSGGSAVYIGLGICMCGLAMFQLLSMGGEKSVAEVQLLLGGMWTLLSRGADAARTLPHAGPDSSRDAIVCGIFTVALFSMNWGVRLFLVEPMARLTLGMPKAALIKYAQSWMEAVFYACFATLGLVVVPSQKWVWPSSSWWDGFAAGGHEIMRSDLRCYYLLYMARYLQAIGCVLLEPRRKDFIEMQLHHIVTVVVIYISYLYGWNRVGVVVMVLLDPADVPLHLAKLCKYTAEATNRWMWQFLADRLFEIFALVFFVTRLVMYSYVVWSAHIEASRYFPKHVAEWACVALLYLLWLLQMYWFFLIMRVALRLLKGQSVEDPRSDDEGSHELKASNGEKKKNK